MATQLEPIVVTVEEENKQLEFEDIKKCFYFLN